MTSNGLARIKVSACPQGNNGPSQPFDFPQSSTYDAANVMRSPSVVATSVEIPSRVLCTLEEEDRALSDDEVLSDDGSKLQLVCKESRVGASLNELDDSRDEPSPIYSLPPKPLWAGLHSN